MNDRLLLLDGPVLSSQTNNTGTIDVQWLSPIDSFLSMSTNDERICHKVDGSVTLRLITCNSKTTGNAIRQYFIEDLFRSMLLRINLALINNEENGSNENNSTAKLVLPRRVYVTQPFFISAYQLVHEPLSMVVESIQDNFKVSSIIEDDLEAAEEFPLEITSDDRAKQFNSNMNTLDKDVVKRSGNMYKDLFMSIKRQLSERNMWLFISLITILVALVSVMIKMF